MIFDIFTKPSDTFRNALEDPTIKTSILIVLITTIIFSTIAFLITNNLFTTTIVFISFIGNWFIFSTIFWIFSLIFVSKKRHLIKSNFIGILTATSRLWLILLLTSIFSILSLLGGLVTSFSGVIIIILLTLLFIYSFILMRVILESNNLRTIVIWFLAIVLYSLINSIFLAFLTLFL